MRIQEFNYFVDILSAILWEYNSAPHIQSLLESKQEWYDVNQTEFWEDWFTNVFNLQTADEFGLAVWSIILDLPLQIGFPHNDGFIFGFGSETDTPNGFVNFDNGNFSTTNEVFILTVPEQRLLLKLRYFQLVSNCSVPAANSFLQFAFQEYPNTVYIIDGLKMFIRVVFTFDVSSRLFFIIRLYDLIPRASGVDIEYITRLDYIFGFGPEDATPNNYVNFENGNFGEIITS